MKLAVAVGTFVSTCFEELKQAVLGAILFTTPWWSVWLMEVHTVMSTIAATCGAIVGLRAVGCMIWKCKPRRGVDYDR